MVWRELQMKVFITGITGFVGSHLVDYLLSLPQKIEIYGFLRWRSPLDNINHCVDRVNLCYGDLTDQSSLLAYIDEIRPDIVFHLGAQSYVDFSFKAPIATLQSNCIGTANLLEVVRQLKHRDHYDPIIHICSSSEVYGQVRENETPITEDNPFRPASPYAVSKVTEDMLALQYYLSWGLKTIRTRMFTHTGARRGKIFATSTFAKQIAEIEKRGKEPNIYVGNLDSIRTFMDVRDAVKAYWLLVNNPVPGEVYNIGGNKTMTIGEMLDTLISLSSVKGIKKIIDPQRLRPSDVTLQIPCSDKFKKLTGWEPIIPFEDTMLSLLNYWRDLV
jgi:GDP-mannose 4,6-dehydratase